MDVRRTFNHHRPDWVSEDAIYFVTVCTTPRGMNQLCHPGIARELFESAWHRVDLGQWWLLLLTLMPDHLHMLVAFPSAAGMERVIADWKRYTAVRQRISWQRDFFEHRLRHDESCRDKTAYIVENPVRAGLASRSEDWPYTWMPAPLEGGALGDRALPTR